MSIYGEPLLTGAEAETASGSIVSTSDALAAPLRSLLVDIKPMQDLHGYDNPWPAGGGKNLFGFEEYLKANNVTYTKNGNTYTVTIVDSSLFQNPWVFSDADVAVTISASAYTAGTATNPRIDLLNSDGNVVSNLSPAYLTNQGTACKARINWSTLGTFTVSEPMIELGNTKTSFAPYSNICPISGWSECNMWRTGKNLLPSVLTQSGSTIVVLGQNNNTDFGLSLKAGTYTVSLATENLGTFYYKANNGTSNVHIGAYNVTSATFTLTEDTVLRLYYYKSAGVSVSDISNPQLELGSTASAYEPYRGNTYTIQLGQTVYGGTLDVTNGVLAVDRAMVDLGTLNWSYNPTYAFFTSGSLANRAKGVTNLKSDLFKTTAGSWSGTPLQNAIWGNGSNATIYVQIPPYDNVADFVQLVAGHQLVYELVTPIEIPLTPTEISTLQGQNNTWSDNGDNTMEYLRRSLTYIS